METVKEGATFIAGSPRSGTTLMAALLDDHPELLVFPEEYLYLRPHSALDENSRHLPANLFKEKVLLRLQGKKGFLDALHQEERHYGRFDYQRFETEVDTCFRSMVDEERDTPGGSVFVSALTALVCGYARVMDREHHVRWVIKHPNYELHWQQLFRDFPQAKILYMVRDPREVILSRTLKRNKKQYLKRGGEADAWKSEESSLRPSIRFFREWERSVGEAVHIGEGYPDSILTVRYEDLVSAPHQCMREVSEFLGVPWHENLVKPSFLGTPWNGNSMQEQTFQGVNGSLGNKKHQFPPHHLWQIDAWLGDVMVKEPGKYAFSPHMETIDIKALASWLRGESLASFFQNRLRMLSNQRRRYRLSS